MCECCVTQAASEFNHYPFPFFSFFNRQDMKANQPTPICAMCRCQNWLRLSTRSECSTEECFGIQWGEGVRLVSCFHKFSIFSYRKTSDNGANPDSSLSLLTVSTCQTGIKERHVLETVVDNKCLLFFRTGKFQSANCLNIQMYKRKKKVWYCFIIDPN